MLSHPDRSDPEQSNGALYLPSASHVFSVFLCAICGEQSYLPNFSLTMSSTSPIFSPSILSLRARPWISASARRFTS